MTNSTLPHDHQPQLQLQQKQEQAPVVHKQPQMMKKQTRRRTHASRPYQERLLNMAEARREIVTALKIHRANMRQQQPTYQHQESTLLRQSPSLHLQQQQQQVAFHHDRSQAAAVEEEAAPAPASYAAPASFADHQLCNPLAQWIAAAAAPAGAGSYCYSSPVLLPYDLTPLEAPTPTAAIMGGVDVEWHGLEHLARSLPAQPLGLNLSFHGFGGGFVDASNDGEVLFGGGAPLIQSSSSPAASSHAAYSPIATEAASGALGSPALSSTAEKYSSPVDAPAAAAALMPVAPDDGETRSAGVGLCEAKTAEDVAAASAWWSKILLESVGESGGEVVEGGAAVGCCTAEENVAAAAAAGLPAEWRWLCDDGAGAGEQGAATGGDEPPDVVLETMHAADGEYNNCCYQGGHRSDGADDGITALPCMDDIEGWDDGEWFSCSS